MPDNQDYYIVYGFGYAKYLHTSNDIIQDLTIYVPSEDSVKVNYLTLKNTLPRKRSLRIIYYVKLVLDEDEIKSDKYMYLEFKENSNMIIAKNLINENFKESVYISSSEKINSYTGNKTFFFGKGNISNPEALKKIGLNNEIEFGKNSIIAIELNVELEAYETKEISIVLGEEEKQIECQDMAYKYTKINNCIRRTRKA